MMMRANARHRREPSVRQRIRASIGLLVLLALIAAFGVFGSGSVGGESWQASIVAAAPVPPRVLGWAIYAVPLAGLFGLLAPSRWGVLRAVLSLFVFVPGLALMAVMSKPRGMLASQWAIDPAFARAQEVTTYALAGALFLWAIVAVIVIGVRRVEEVLLTVRRSVLWAGPLTIVTSLGLAIIIS
ncbi:MAG TPA: hypothetical protein VFC19_27655 [Candidatus Limnocylindrales bacterium]|nr:hypothetical protein [Candidatus Limnocylindrales bacterium]